MELKEFIDDKKIPLARFADILEMPYHRLYNISIGKHSANLIDAMKIFRATDSKVSLFEVLNKSEKDIFAKWFNEIEKTGINLDQFVKKKYKKEGV